MFSSHQNDDCWTIGSSVVGIICFFSGHFMRHFDEIMLYATHQSNIARKHHIHCWTSLFSSFLERFSSFPRSLSSPLFDGCLNAAHEVPMTEPCLPEVHICMISMARRITVITHALLLVRQKNRRLSMQFDHYHMNMPLWKEKTYEDISSINEEEYTCISITRYAF